MIIPYYLNQINAMLSAAVHRRSIAAPSAVIRDSTAT